MRRDGPGEDQEGDRTELHNGSNDPGYAGGTESPSPCEPPYSGTPTGAAQSDELRGDLQHGRGAPHGLKRDSSSATVQGVGLRAVRGCLDDGPLRGGHSSGGGRSSRAGRVYLLSLFDGAGTAMVAMVELFAALWCQDRFAGGWFAESEDHLAVPVARHWAERRRQGVPSFERVAGDVWDLLRHKGRLLAGMPAEIEPGALLVVIGGSPCQQLTLPVPAHPRRDASWNF